MEKFIEYERVCSEIIYSFLAAVGFWAIVIFILYYHPIEMLRGAWLRLF
jgi:hypothetical protein